jgi:hypothetical protein
VLARALARAQAWDVGSSLALREIEAGGCGRNYAIVRLSAPKWCD